MLESKMQKAQTISSLVLSLRKGNDQGTSTITKVMIPVLDEDQNKLRRF
jgi:isoleucyl-tRNA synthetase